MTALSTPSETLLRTCEMVTEEWMVRSCRRVLDATPSTTHRDSSGLPHEIAQAVEAARDRLLAELRVLLTTDVDEQSTNPLSLFRDGARPLTEALERAGCVPVARDPFEQRRFGDDVYGIGPATWADIDERLVDPGLGWGAWKAMTILQRRRAEGMR